MNEWLNYTKQTQKPAKAVGQIYFKHKGQKIKTFQLGEGSFFVRNC